MVRYLTEDQDFDFPTSEGWTGSAVGRHDAKDHNRMSGLNDSGDGGYPERGMAKGGRAKLAFGGEPTQPMPGPQNIPAQSGALNQSAVTPPNANRIQAARNLVAASAPTSFRAAAAQAPAKLMAPRPGAAVVRPTLRPLAGAPTATTMKNGGRIRRASGGAATETDLPSQGEDTPRGGTHMMKMSRIVQYKGPGDYSSPVYYEQDLSDQSRPSPPQNEPGPTVRANGGRIRKADGGPIYNADPQTTAMMQQGAQPPVQQGMPPQIPPQALAAAQARMQQMGAQPGQQMQQPQMGSPVMAARGGFIKSAVKHPGRMREGAAREGVSVHRYMEEKKHSSDPSLRAAANLGLRLTGGDLSPRKKGK